MTRAPVHGKAIVALQVQFCRNSTITTKNPPLTKSTISLHRLLPRKIQHNSPQAVFRTEDHLSKVVLCSVAEGLFLLLPAKGFSFYPLSPFLLFLPLKLCDLAESVKWPLMHVLLFICPSFLHSSSSLHMWCSGVVGQGGWGHSVSAPHHRRMPVSS